MTNDLLSQTEEELYMKLGGLVMHEKGLIPSNDELNRVGRAWMQANLEAIRKQVCESKVSTAIMKDTDSSKLLIGLADLLAGLYGSIPAYTVSAIVIKIGLTKFCQRSSGL